MREKKRLVKINLAKLKREPTKKKFLSIDLGLRKEDVHRYLPIFLGFVVAIVIVFVINLYLSLKLASLERDYKEKQLKLIDALSIIKSYGEVSKRYSEVKTKKVILEELAKPIEILSVVNDSIKRVVPPALWLSNLEIDLRGKSVTIVGNSLTDDAISKFISNLKNETWVRALELQEIRLTKVKAGSEVEHRQFKIKVDLK